MRYLVHHKPASDEAGTSSTRDRIDFRLVDRSDETLPSLDAKPPRPLTTVTPVWSTWAKYLAMSRRKLPHHPFSRGEMCTSPTSDFKLAVGQKKKEHIFQQRPFVIFSIQRLFSSSRYPLQYTSSRAVGGTTLDERI